jgi:hypothetical protein
MGNLQVKLQIPVKFGCYRFIKHPRQHKLGWCFMFLEPCPPSVFPFSSVIPKRKIFFWYLVVGGCIPGDRCVAQKNYVDPTFDLNPVTRKPKFPSALYLLSEWRFFIDIWRDDVSGDKGVSHKILVLMRPLTLTQNCIIIPFLYLWNEWRFFIDIWWEDVSGDKGMSCERIVSMWPLTLTMWHWNWNSLPLCIS